MRYNCWLRQAIRPEECVQNTSSFETFTVIRVPPPPEPPSPPEPPPSPPLIDRSKMLPSNVTEVRVTSDEIVTAKKQASARIGSMHRRASILKECTRKTRWSLPSEARLQLRGDPGHPASRTEVIVCPGAKVAFIHVYKAAGTTIIATLHDLCQSINSQARLLCGGYDEFPWPVLEGDKQMWCDQTLDEAWPTIKDYSWFTFVREPVDRFASGVFENAYRAKKNNYTTCVTGPNYNGPNNLDVEGDELAEAVLRNCLHNLPPFTYDPHLKPQLDYLLESDNATVLPQLDYIGHVERIADDWSALVSHYFGAQASAQVKLLLKDDELHARSRSSTQYPMTNGLDPKFENLHMSAKGQELIFNAYRADGECLGYSTEDFTKTHAENLKVPQPPRGLEESERRLRRGRILRRLKSTRDEARSGRKPTFD